MRPSSTPAMYCGDSRSTQSSFLGGLRRLGRADDGGTVRSALKTASESALGSALGSAAAAFVLGRAPSDRTEVRKALDEASSDASDAFASPAVPSSAAASAPLMMPVRCHQVPNLEAEAAADPLPNLDPFPNLDPLPVVAAPAPAAPAPTPPTPTAGGLASGARAVLCAANGRLPSGDRISPPKLHKT